MKRELAKNIDELIKIWEESVDFEPEDEDEEGNPILYRAYTFDFKDVDIDFELRLPFSAKILQRMEDFLFQNIGTITFNNCKFCSEVYLGNANQNIEFINNCVFEDTFRAFGFKNNLTLKDCRVSSLNFENSRFGGSENSTKSKGGKIRFHDCQLYLVNFRNTVFGGLVDFWNSTFNKSVIFYKTDFLGVVVFSAVTFKENVLFTYTLIEKGIIFRGTSIEAGFDISTALRSGNMEIFDFHIKDFPTLNKTIDADEYEKAISENAKIPIKNKRETFRILKQEYISQNNVVHSIEYKTLEKETLRIELRTKRPAKTKSVYNRTLFYLEKNLDQFNLWLNKISNNHGSSYGRAFLFVVFVGWPFFFGSVMATSKYDFHPDFSIVTFWDGLKYFVQFLLPTHNFEYLGDGVQYGTLFYVFDFFGRLFVGYGMYQFIQAFRKFR